MNSKPFQLGVTEVLVRAIEELANCADNIEAQLLLERRTLAPGDKRRTLRVRKGAVPIMQAIGTFAKS
jgi:hypothetical protein